MLSLCIDLLGYLKLLACLESGTAWTVAPANQAVSIKHRTRACRVAPDA